MSSDVTITKVVGSEKCDSPHLTGVKRPRAALRRDSHHDIKLSCRVGGWHSRDDWSRLETYILDPVGTGLPVHYEIQRLSQGWSVASNVQT